MPSVIQPAEFFVVGGPVQPERSCYVEREADRRLDDALRAKRLCCVLGPRAIGKSSLLHRAARGLRAAGVMVATLDLRRIAEQGSETPDECLRLVAERIVAELKLGVDVPSWWGARGAVGGNRLVDFYWEVVLTNTTAPIMVLLDDVDAALELPFAADLFGAIGICQARRGREPDFARLGFVLAGCTTKRELTQACPDSGVTAAHVIEPEDFTPEQAYTLAAAFGGVQELAQALMDRICAWTGGHPYLTQRVARGVARKGGRLEDVERVVREQLLELPAADKDPLLAHVRAWLGEPSRPALRATKLLQKLAAGAERAQPADVAVWERLWLSGTVRTDGERGLRIRNRIFKELVAAGWLKTKSSASKWLAAAAVALVAIAAGGYWYTQRLPVADIETLTNVTAEPAAVEEAYRRLRALPGFEQRADELWLEALGRQSRMATTLAAAAAADTRLRELPGQENAADRLLGDFWLRRARERAHAEQREAAILLAQRAAALPSADRTAALYLAELAGDDWSRLERSLLLARAPEYWSMTFDRATFVSIDADGRAVRTPFGADAGPATPDAAPVELSALAHSALTRELAVEGEGTAGELELSLAVQHAAAGELLVTLTAPSGAVAAVGLPRGDGAAVETLMFQAAAGSPLAQLADEAVRGVWRLTVVDRAAGNAGSLGAWGLRFGDTGGRDDLPELVPIPDPSRTNDVNVRAVAERAVAWPVSAGVVGTLALWNLATGQLEHDLALPAAPQHVALDPTGARVLAATDRLLTLWSVDGALVARVGTETEFVLPPVFSADGGHIAIAERLDGANPLYSVLRSVDGSLVGTIEGVPEVQGWELGPGGRYVVLQGPETIVRVVETRRGAELRRLPHAHAVERLLHTTDGAELVTVDRAGGIASWPLAVASAALGRPLGRTAAAASVSASADGRRIAYTRDDGAVAVVDVTAGAELYRLRLPRAVPVTGTQLSADGTELVTQSGAALKRWSLPAKPVTPRTRTAAVPTALALDRSSDVVAVGLPSGQLQLAPAAAAGAPSELAFFGHRGAITAAALNGSRGLVATGGSDGIVRVWDLASGVPTGAVAQPVAAPITLVALSADGRYVASAAERTVRVATVTEGRVTTEVQVERAVTALALAPDAARVAVGDASGIVVIAPLAADARQQRLTVQLDAAATSLAFSSDGRRLAAADAGGGIALVSAAEGDLEANVRHWPHPLRWVEFSPDGSALLAATDAWVHALAAATPALAATHSRLVVWPANSAVSTAISSTVVGYAGAEIDGSVVSRIVDFTAAPGAPSDDPSTLIAHDWPAAFGLRLNDNGDPVPFDP